MTLEDIYQIFLNHPQVTTDSRKIEPGSLFFALKGENFNGNLFALSAIERGAAFAIVDDAAYVVNDRILLVENVLQTLQRLASHHRQRLGTPILAITGTNGKTTTNEPTASVQSKKFTLSNTGANLITHIGVPLTLLTLQAETEFAVIEMGANHPGEIAALCNIALPDYGLITNIGSAHLEGFGSFEGVVQTKTELYRFIEQNNGTLFVNNANPILTLRTGKSKKVGYSTSSNFDGLEGGIVSADPLLVVKALFPKGWLYIKTNLVGGYNMENVLAAAAIGQYFSIDPMEIASAIEGYQPDNNRSQMVVTERNKLLMDAYNANPSSTHAALENFAKIAAVKKGVILGDMLELGSYSREEHQKIADTLSALNLDLVLLTGTNYTGCKVPDSFRCFNHSSELAAYLKQEHLSGYLLLIKGSRGMQLETIRPEL